MFRWERRRQGKNLAAGGPAFVVVAGGSEGGREGGGEIGDKIDLQIDNVAPPSDVSIVE